MADLLPTILTAFATTMATKGAEAPANTFNEAWKYVFGSLDSSYYEKMKNVNMIMRSTLNH